MLIRQIALLSETKKVNLPELMKVSAALQKQVSRDFAPIWNIQATVDGFASEGEVPPGYWKIKVMDKIPVKGASGFHLDEQGQPFADVLWSLTWSLAASHECLEMLADPFGHQLAPGPSPIASQGRVNFLVEVCDPCEAPQFAYTINTGSGMEVTVSDFYAPEYFSPTQGPSVQYSFRSNIKSPREVLNGGYLSWQNPADGHIWQVFGPVGMGQFVDQGPGTLNRETTDRRSQATRLKFARARLMRKPARGRAALTAAGGQCNLTFDSATGNLDGTAGQQTTVQIKDSSGNAVFQSISYAGTTIGTATASASFTIKAGSNNLTYVYAAPIPGDAMSVSDPCGTRLDVFNNDFANPIRSLIVTA